MLPRPHIFSWGTDCHKWLNVPYDCGVAFVRDAGSLRDAMIVSAAYLHTGNKREPAHYSPEASRRARGVEVWAAIRSLGRSGLAELIERNCRLAKRFAESLRQGGFNVLNDVVLNQLLVSFGSPETTRLTGGAMDRRNFIRRSVFAGALAWTGAVSKAHARSQHVSKNIFDVAIIGAGVFGSWTAYFLKTAGQRVLLLDAYGPSNDRASSGGETRIIRMGYGPDDIYTRWAQRALPRWKELFTRTGTPLFHRTGVLWICNSTDRYSLQTEKVLTEAGVNFQKLSHSDVRERYPQIAVDDDAVGIFEPESGVLMARRAVQTLVENAVQMGIEYRTAAAVSPTGGGNLDALQMRDGTPVSAGTYVFACGPWLPKLFPRLLGSRIIPTKQEVFFFGIPPGDLRFSPPNLPTWIILSDEYYGMPDLENRGFKIAYDGHGVPVDPDTVERVASPEGLASARAYIARRFPGLKDAPVMESRVCQYENTSNGDFLIDRHPDFGNVWLVGGGSGHGFKHGPSLGEYVANRVLGKGVAESRFSLKTKAQFQKRNVY